VGVEGGWGKGGGRSKEGSRGGEWVRKRGGGLFRRLRTQGRELGFIAASGVDGSQKRWKRGRWGGEEGRIVSGVIGQTPWYKGGTRADRGGLENPKRKKMTGGKKPTGVGTV